MCCLATGGEGLLGKKSDRRSHTSCVRRSARQPRLCLYDFVNTVVFAFAFLVHVKHKRRQKVAKCQRDISRLLGTELSLATAA